MYDMDCINRVNKRFAGRHTQRCLECPYFWLRYNSLNYNINTQNFFAQYQLADLKIENKNEVYVGSYKELENKIIEYYRKTCMLQYSTQNSNDLEQGALAFSTGNYENKVKEMLKTSIDMAAHAAKKNNHQLSILLDGIGLVYADDLVEAVDKVISMLDTALKAYE